MRYLQARKALEAPLKWGAFYSKCMNISDLFSAGTQAAKRDHKPQSPPSNRQKDRRTCLFVHINTNSPYLTLIGTYKVFSPRCTNTATVLPDATALICLLKASTLWLSLLFKPKITSPRRIPACAAAPLLSMTNKPFLPLSFFLL